MAEKTNINMVLPEARANYVYVFKPRKSDDDDDNKDPAYSITLAFDKDKTDAADISAIRKNILKAAQAKWGAQALDMLKRKKISSPLHDGDDNDDESMHGHWLMTARRKESFGPPGVVDDQVQRIIDQTDFYSGCFCYASVSFFPYEVKGKKGVGVGLNNVQKVRDGERIGGKPDPKNEFQKLAPAKGAKKPGGKGKTVDDYDDEDDDIPY